MSKSILVLGRQPELGLAELESLYGVDTISLVNPHVALLDQPIESISFSRLGGSTRLGRVLAEVPGKMWKDVEKELVRLLPGLATALPEGKIRLGLSAIGIPVTPQKLMASGLTLKKVLRNKTGRSIRLVPNTEPELNAAQILHNQLTGQTGIEVLVIATSAGNTLLAQTTAIQDIDAYAERDRGRPKRDARVGMLPPKLAQVIINLANPTPGGVVLDPFCGTGVILQEALLAGYEVYGTDLEPRMAEYTTANMEWLTGKNYPGVTGNYRVEQGDATDFQWTQPIDAVAGETYLGRPFTDKPAPEILAQTVSEVNLILKKFMKNIYGQLAPGTPLCLAVPAWHITPGTFKHLPLIDQLEELGYNRTRFEHVRDEQLLYYREDQTVARELLVLTRK